MSDIFPASSVETLYHQLKPLLFRLDAETAHERSNALLATASSSSDALEALGSLAPKPDHRLAMSAFGIDFRFPLGIAAGFDKAGTSWPALTALGFGFVEIGTVTLRPQEGNPRPRVFRIPKREALINCMGFPGPGVNSVCRNLESVSSPAGIFGSSIGPNRDAVDLQSAMQECAQVYRKLAPRSMFTVINPSSPNTPRLRNLLAKPAIGELLSHLCNVKRDIGGPPLGVKISPDLTDREIDEVVDAAITSGIDGIVATNTSNQLPPDLADHHSCPAGGLSGRPVSSAAAHAVKRVAQRASGHLAIIAAGGIFSGADVVAATLAGASLVQTYTGFVYRGPSMPAMVSVEILNELDRLGVDKLADIRGQAVH